jgi:hypothetical protein
MACVYVETIQTDVKTIQTDVKEAGHQNMESVRLEWRCAVLWIQKSFIRGTQPISSFLYSNTATCFGPKTTNFWLPTQNHTVK